MPKPPPSNPTDQEILRLCNAGYKIQAVKYCMDSIPGMDLLNAKEYVERLEADYNREELPNSQQPPSDPIDRHIIELCQDGKKLEAIKYCKDFKNVGLKESKDYVEQLAAQYGLEMKSGCFIATACYGNYHAPEVLVLRNFRDEVLLKRAPGRVFVKCYYALSPFFAERIRHSTYARRLVRELLLRPLVCLLKQNR